MPPAATTPSFPDFLGIGGQKCATTWLYANLQRHPHIFLPKTKELHFFDLNFTEDLTGYLDNFREAGARIFGEITPSYGILGSERIAFIRDRNPALKLILQIRNPIERAWSHAVMDLCKLRERHISTVSDDEFRRHFASKPSRDRGGYLKQIDNWRRHFPKEQLHLSFMEQVSENPRGLLLSLFQFLGATTDVDWSTFRLEKKVHVGVSQQEGIPPHLLDNLLDLYRDDIEQLHDRFGDSIARWHR